MLNGGLELLNLVFTVEFKPLCLYFLEDLKIFNTINVFRNWHTDRTVSATCIYCIKIHATSAQPSISN